MRISWIDISERIEHELRALREEGAHVGPFAERWNAMKRADSASEEWRGRAEEFYREIEAGFPASRPFPGEPSAWGEATQMRGHTAELVPSHPRGVLEDKIMGGWVGRAAGCLLGKPVEKLPRHAIEELLISNGTWPIRDYITEKGIPAPLLEKYPWNKHYGRESLRENIVCMPEDDDMNYPMLNLHILESAGRDFTSEDVVRTWVAMLPALSTFTAERVAYMNALAGAAPPRTAQIRNPYREWIGAQIRADVWGWASPGQPLAAAELAWRDASVSHVRNGIYGEAFFAAAIAASFESSDIRAVVHTALGVVPPDSRFAIAIRSVLARPVESTEWEVTVDWLYDTYGHYHWVHTINNAALVVAALLAARNDFAGGISRVVMGGWDTDSNGATVGSVLGTMLGARRLPREWIDPLHDRIRTSLKGFDNASFTDLARRTLQLAQSHSPR